MANPITWQNVTGPSPADALRPMLAAQGSMNTGFDALQAALKQRQDMETGNWNQVAQNNKRNFMNTLLGAKTPQEMEALQQSGQLTQMLGTAQIADPNELQLAMDGRLGALQNRAFEATKNQEYVANASNRTKMAEYALAEAALKPAEAQARIGAQEAASVASKSGDILNVIKINEAGKAAELARKAAEAQAKLQVINERGDNIHAEGALKPGDSEAIMAMIKAAHPNEPPEKQAKLLAAIYKHPTMQVPHPTEKGKMISVPTPLGLVKSLLAGSEDELFSGVGAWNNEGYKDIDNGLWNGGMANNYEQLLGKREKEYRKTYIGKDEEGNDVARNAFLDSLDEVRAAQANKAANPSMGKPGKAAAPYKQGSSPMQGTPAKKQ